MRKIEDLVNAVTVWCWWPAFTKPQPERRMTTRWILGISVFYSVAYGVPMGVLVGFLLHGYLLQITIATLQVVVIGIVGLFLTFRLIISLFWNRRADRLSVG